MQLPVCLIRASDETCAALPDDFPNTWEITNSRQPLIPSDMGMQSCLFESLILLQQAATLGGDNKKGEQSWGTLLQSMWIHLSQRLYAV